MSGIATAVIGGAVISAGVSSYGAQKAGKAAESAAATEAGAQMEQLAYLKEREAVPQYLREAGLERMAGLAGIGYTVDEETGEIVAAEGDAFGAQAEMIERAKASPLYGAITGGRAAGEEAIMRRAGATGGLRSGNIQEALYDYNTQLENRALLESYQQERAGLAGLAGLPSGAQQIGQTMADIGATRAAGQIAAGEAKQQGYEDISSSIMGGLGLGIKAGII